MCSPASAIFARFFVKINFKSQFQRNDLPKCKYIKIASELTSIVTINVNSNIALAGEHIFQVLAQYS